MYNYTALQWIFIFFFFSFFGWVWECIYIWIQDKVLTNRGFMRGPFLPLYGTGGLMLLFVSMPVRDSIVLTFLVGSISATILEFITGITMEALFKVKYWDYSFLKIQYKGIISLLSSLAWGGMTVFLNKLLYPFVHSYVIANIPIRVLNVVTILLIIGTSADFALSFKAAIDLRDILVKLEKAKKEMERIQKRLDVLIAVAGDGLENAKDSVGEKIVAAKDAAGEKISGVKEAAVSRIDVLTDNLEDKFRVLREKLKRNPSMYAENEKDELSELRGNFIAQKTQKNEIGKLRGFIQRGILRGNPNITSSQYAEELETLKKNFNEKEE